MNLPIPLLNSRRTASPTAPSGTPSAQPSYSTHSPPPSIQTAPSATYSAARALAPARTPATRPARPSKANCLARTTRSRRPPRSELTGSGNSAGPGDHLPVILTTVPESSNRKYSGIPVRGEAAKVAFLPACGAVGRSLWAADPGMDACQMLHVRNKSRLASLRASDWLRFGIIVRFSARFEISEATRWGINDHGGGRLVPR